MTADHPIQNNHGTRPERQGGAGDDGCEGCQRTTGDRLRTLRESMSDESTEALSKYGGISGLGVVGGVACCVGLKLIGGAVLFSGLATTFGLTTGQTTFLVGGAVGLLLAVLVLRNRRPESGESTA